MAQRTTHGHRRILAAPEPNPTVPQIQSQSSDPLILPSNSKKKHFSITNHLSRLNLNPHTHSHQPTRVRDIHLQAKSMTLSLDAADSSIIRAKDKARPRKDLDKRKQQNHQKNKKIIALGAVREKPDGSLGRRRSFGGSQVELGDILANCGVKIVSVDMPPFMQIHAVDCARKTHDSLEKFTSKTLALTLKKEFDGVYGPAWHCIVGTSFGSFVTHSVGGFLYFSMDQKLYVLLFKTTVQRAD
ncbi:Dynein light chain, type 1/2 [Corchorus olitorius]|uniref:Dynein light chain, type 1/2 n=1 Tax=Corchorus olitorius TaxID=93759 RepID=A0A1R3IUJ3_9ROSI|nr:Dynein light chain, type 1/2 [Corchorus olitorius]